MYASAEQLPLKTYENFSDETRHRNDTVTWLAETLHGSMRTSFDYYFDGQELYAEDGGAMGEVFDSSITTARQIVELNPNLLFELRRRLIERAEYQDMLSMASGELFDRDGKLVNTMVVVSDFPEELMTTKEDIGGYNANRKQTMLRVITRTEEGYMNMTTQSLDGSDRLGLEAIYEKLDVVAKPGELLDQRINFNLPEKWQGQLVDNLRDTYDQSLANRLGGNWHAGIKQSSEDSSVNTAEFVAQQTDLINWFVGAKLSNPIKAEKLRYDLAATIEDRFNKLYSRNTQIYGTEILTTFNPNNLFVEIEIASQRAVQKGVTYSGCGMSVKADGLAGQLEESGYGNKSGKDNDEDCEFISKECPMCHKKNVKTTSTKSHIKGDCGCSVKK